MTAVRQHCFDEFIFNQSEKTFQRKEKKSKLHACALDEQQRKSTLLLYITAKCLLGKSFTGDMVLFAINQVDTCKVFSVAP